MLIEQRLGPGVREMRIVLARRNDASKLLTKSGRGVASQS